MEIENKNTDRKLTNNLEFEAQSNTMRYRYQLGGVTQLMARREVLPNSLHCLVNLQG